jgi:acyl-coenzyme A thioesterase PaaI-like protein
MRKIKNPWNGLEGFRCFGCSNENESGLQMEFYDNGNEIICIWKPKSHFQGWIDILHGGIQCALMDEMAAWVVIKELKTSGVTSRMDTRFVKGIKTDEGAITISGKLNRMIRNVAVIDVVIKNQSGEICTKGEIFFFTFPREVAVNELNHKDFEYENDNITDVPEQI